MSTANVELDFFDMENQATASNSHRHRRRSLKDIQSAISKIDPEILKSVIASASAEHRTYCGSRSSECDQHLSSLPLYSPTARMSPEDGSDKYPLTIFYNATVAVFHVSSYEAKNILTLAEKGGNTGNSEVEKGKSTAEIPSNQHQQLVDVDAQDEDLPLARKRSLQRFLEKRKERLIPAWPYACRF